MRSARKAGEARRTLAVEFAKIAVTGAVAGAAVHAVAHLLLRPEISFWDIAIAGCSGALAALAAIFVVGKVYIGGDDWGDL